MLTTWIEPADVESGDVVARTRMPGVASMTRDGAWVYEFGLERGAISPVHFHRIRIEDPEPER